MNHRIQVIEDSQAKIVEEKVLIEEVTEFKSINDIEKVEMSIYAIKCVYNFNNRNLIKDAQKYLYAIDCGA